MPPAYHRHDISDSIWESLAPLLLGRKGTWATHETTANLSMAYFGFCVRVRLGEICLLIMETGKIPTVVFADGETKEYGSGFWRH
jgi:transposase